MRGIAFAVMLLIAGLASRPATADKNEPNALDRPSESSVLVPGHPCRALDERVSDFMDDEQRDQWYQERNALIYALAVALSWEAPFVGVQTVKHQPAAQLLSLLSALLVTACAPQFLTTPSAEFRPERSAFDALQDMDRLLHAEAQQAALEAREQGRSVAWAGVSDGVRGSITVTETVRLKTGLVCRRLTDRLDGSSGVQTVNDAACWSGGQWIWLRAGEPQQQILAHAT